MPAALLALALTAFPPLEHHVLRPISNAADAFDGLEPFAIVGDLDGANLVCQVSVDPTRAWDVYEAHPNNRWDVRGARRSTPVPTHASHGFFLSLPEPSHVGHGLIVPYVLSLLWPPAWRLPFDVTSGQPDLVVTLRAGDNDVEEGTNRWRCGCNVNELENTWTKLTAPPRSLPVWPNSLARFRCQRKMALTRQRSSARNSFGSFTTAKRRANGSERVHCRYPTSGSTLSKCAAVS